LFLSPLSLIEHFLHTMRLITHNMVQCHVKDCNTNNFPLRFEDAEVELIEAEYNPTFLINMLPKLDWEALINTAVQVRSLS
jgi:multifunctional methyltransferase subunit TRM112